VGAGAILYQEQQELGSGWHMQRRKRMRDIQRGGSVGASQAPMATWAWMCRNGGVHGERRDTSAFKERRGRSVL
jgi:hypothetical protein